MKVRVGFGFDVHQLKDGHPFWIGGIQVPHEKGAFGHSDADVLLHAICDALLGAANLKDIGYHFPDTSDEFKGADSKKLLKEVLYLIRDKGYEIGNIDCTLCLERPKIKPHIDEMCETIANILEIDRDEVSVKATTSEKMGYVGKEEGVVAYAVALISKGI